MSRNVELLERTMQFIDDHPERHDQRSYGYRKKCGTFACFAGWACVLSGGVTWTKQHDGSKRLIQVRDLPTSLAAQRLLGLDDREARALFAVDNTSEVLKLMVKDLVNGDALKEPRSYFEELGQWW